MNDPLDSLFKCCLLVSLCSSFVNGLLALFVHLPSTSFQSTLALFKTILSTSFPTFLSILHLFARIICLLHPPRSLTLSLSPLACLSISQQPRRGNRATPLTHDERAAARPPWTPYPVRFLLSTSLHGSAVRQRHRHHHPAGAAPLCTAPRRRVAVVDDNAVNRMVARRTLQGYGADMLLLASGEDTLQVVSSSNMDPSPSTPLQLLLLDLHMPPGIDGFETARRIRQMESEQQLSIVAETTAANEADAAGAGQAGTAAADEAGTDEADTASKAEGANEARADDEAASEFSFQTPQELTTAADGSDNEFSFQTPQESTALGEAVKEEAAGLRRACPQRLCIIALTADLDVGVKRACFEAGMDGAVRKTIVAHELLAVLVDAGFADIEMDDALVL
ncbi:unnamed protein product [Closterium sp. Naga37s-1]|nr:unnamed protein product [Closterium sp. Naga37s-1]